MLKNISTANWKMYKSNFPKSASYVNNVPLN